MYASAAGTSRDTAEAAAAEAPAAISADRDDLIIENDEFTAVPRQARVASRTGTAAACRETAPLGTGTVAEREGTFPLRSAVPGLAKSTVPAVKASIAAWTARGALVKVLAASAPSAVNQCGCAFRSTLRGP